MLEAQETQVRSPGQEAPLEAGMATPLQSPCLENRMDRGAWQATVHGVSKRRTRLKRLSAHAHRLPSLSVKPP